MTRPAIFLGRDGVINCSHLDHVRSWSEFVFLPGAMEAWRRLAQLDWPIVVVSSHGATAGGVLSVEMVDDIHARMTQAVRLAGGRVDGVFYCPHQPRAGCACRKRKSGLLVTAAQQLQLNLARSFYISSAAGDIVAAKAAGCRPVLVKTGQGVEEQVILRRRQVAGYYLAEDLGDATNWILGPGRLTSFYPSQNHAIALDQVMGIAPGSRLEFTTAAAD